MYITTDYLSKEGFEWDMFFSKDRNKELINSCDKEKLFFQIRELLKEDKFRLSFSFTRLMLELLSTEKIKSNPKILELGAATGFLSRWLLNQYGGRATLVDKSEEAFNSFSLIKDTVVKNISYLREDIFDLSLDQKYDIVGSFGLIEHFMDKTSIIEQHKKYVAEDGVIIISVPTDTVLTRVFMEMHPELNLGYRELLKESELINILENGGLKVRQSLSSNGYVYDFTVAICSL